MKNYIVKRFFVNSVLGPKFAGENLLEREFNLLTEVEKLNVDERKYDTLYDLWGYGLIFYSTEIEFPETPPEETYCEMLCRNLSEVDRSCECK